MLFWCFLPLILSAFLNFCCIILFSVCLSSFLLIGNANLINMNFIYWPTTKVWQIIWGFFNAPREVLDGHRYLSLKFLSAHSEKSVLGYINSELGSQCVSLNKLCLLFEAVGINTRSSVWTVSGSFLPGRRNSLGVFHMVAIISLAALAWLWSKPSNKLGRWSWRHRASA